MTPNFGSVPPTSSFDSRDCIDVVCDLPGDNTIRPMSPERKQLALAELEKLKRWSTPPKPPAPGADATSPENAG